MTTVVNCAILRYLPTIHLSILVNRRLSAVYFTFYSLFLCLSQLSTLLKKDTRSLPQGLHTQPKSFLSLLAFSLPNLIESILHKRSHRSIAHRSPLLDLASFDILRISYILSNSLQPFYSHFVENLEKLGGFWPMPSIMAQTRVTQETKDTILGMQQALARFEDCKLQ